MTAEVRTIPPGAAFVDALAAGIRARTGGDPLALAGVTVLLPTRRACRSLREAFLRAGGGRPMLLPAMRPLGEVESDELALAHADGDWEGSADAVLSLPPAISPLRRRLLLSQLVLEQDKADNKDGGTRMVADQALFLASELTRFLDQMQIEEVPFEALAGIVPESLARHWQDTLKFLHILTEHWPRMLAVEGALDPADRRRRLLDAQAERWRNDPPAGPVIAAGSTGSVPATARLLAVIGEGPAGAVVLPGLDREMPDEAWESLDSTHPQHAMRQLLRGLGVDRRDVADWDAPGVPVGNAAREQLLAQALRPAESWSGDAPQVAAGAVANFYQMTCAGPEEEARAVALALRGALEQPQRTAALVTPDRGLARRVAAELTRWGVSVDDSGGTPLALTRVGAFLRLTAEMVAEGAAPVALLAALKHPLAAGGVKAATFRRRVRGLERLVLRGPRPGAGFDGLLAAVRERGADDGGRRKEWAAEALAWLEPLAEAAKPFARELGAGHARLGRLLRAHATFAETLAADGASSGATRLWSADDGEAASLWVDEVLRESASAPEFEGAHYPAVLTELMSGVVVRPRWPRHPRVHIWGPLEARLQQADLVVLGGLNEGTWPPEPGADPWMSRPMRAQAGLPPPERRVGLSAHDFAQASAAPTAILSRASKVDGEPTVPSRWLVRLDAVLRGAGASLPDAPWRTWQADLDHPGPPDPLQPPRPAPPVAARPRELAATGIEALVRDPYAVYARRVLRLVALEDVDADPGAADRGRFVHSAVDSFLKAIGEGDLPPGARAELLRRGQEEFGAALRHPGVRAFWWPRFERLAAWFVAEEQARRRRAKLVGSEAGGRKVFAGPAGEFLVTARADRIDRFHDGGLAIVDYKTGAPPQWKEIEAGFAPQLAVEAVLAEAGGFPGIKAEEVTELAFWLLHGRDDGGEVKVPRGLDVRAVVDETAAGLEALIAAYDDPDMPYLSRPRPDYGPRFSDYEHLARVQEWSAGPETEDGR